MAASKQDIAFLASKIDILSERIGSLDTKLSDRITKLEQEHFDAAKWDARISTVEANLGLVLHEVGKCLKEADLKTGFDAKMKLIHGDIEASRYRIGVLQADIEKIDKLMKKADEIGILLDREGEGEGKLREILEDSLRAVRAELESLGSRDDKVEAISCLEKKIAEGERLAGTFTVFSYAME